MGYYTRSIEQLNAEYTNRTSISIFGRNTTMLRLFVDSYEVRLRFEKLLEKIKQGPALLEDADMKYQEWANETKWVKPNKEKQESVSQTASTFGFSEDAPFAQTYANYIKDAFGTRLNNINLERFNIIASSVIMTGDVISDYEFDLAIDENIKQLRNTLLEIADFRQNHTWSKKDYSQFYLQLHQEYDNNNWNDIKKKSEHKKWLKEVCTEPDADDYEQRCRELLLVLFKTGFLDAKKKNMHVPATDDLNFSAIQDEEMIPDLNDTLKWYAAFKKLCPRGNENAFRFDEHAALGQYIYDSNIPKDVCWQFFHYTSLIEIIQNEMSWLQHPERKPKAWDKILEIFEERVKQIMKKAEDDNGVKKTTSPRGHETTYIYNIDSKGVCDVIDDLHQLHRKELLDYLADATEKTADSITYVSPFIGFILGTNCFSHKDMPNTELSDAFKFYYGEKTSAVSKMSNKHPTEVAKKLFDVTLEIIKKRQQP